MTNLSAQLYHAEVIESHLSGHYAQCTECKLNGANGP